jgi:hypothetical protein
MLLEEICHSRENTESKTYLIIHQKPLGFCAYAGMTEIKKHICQKWMLPLQQAILTSPSLKRTYERIMNFTPV